MKKKRQKRASVPLFHRELRRHAHYFLVLLSCIFLGVISVFLLVLSNITMRESQDLRQRAATPALPDLVITKLDTEKTSYALAEPVVIRVTVKNKGTASTTIPFNVAIGYGIGVPFSEDFFTTSTNANLVMIDVPLGVDEEKNVTLEIPGSTLAPGYYALMAAPDPRFEDLILELSETDQAYSQTAFQIVSSTTPSPTSTSAPAAENLFFTAAHNLEIFAADTNAPLKLTDIVAGGSYKLRQLVRVQNVVKNNSSTDARSVTVQFRANDSAISSKNFSLSQLQKAEGGIDLVFETAFIGKTSNEFKTTLDSANTVAETNEGDNVLSTTYSYQTTTTSVSAETLATICNSYCANDGECGYGLECWSNRCRHPDYVENERCAPAASVVAGCDISCSSNRDCAAGLACTSGRCRNPKNTSSATCQAAATTVITTKTAEKTSTTGQKGATINTPSPAPTTKPATSAGSLSTTPSASGSSTVGVLQTPTPTVDPTLASPTPVADSASGGVEATEPTIASEVMGWISQVVTPVKEQSSQLPALVLGWFGMTVEEDSTNLWFWLIGGGLLLMILIFLVSLVGGRRGKSSATVPPPHTTNTTTTYAHPPVAQSTPAMAAPKTFPPAAVPASTTRPLPPPNSPATPPNQTPPTLMAAPRPLPMAKPSTSTTPSPMVMKLQDRGVIMSSPVPSAPTPTSKPPTPHTPS